MNKKMYILRGGMIHCDLANMVALANLATADNHSTVSNWVESPVTCMLIENEAGVVLFDTGCHPLAMSERWEGTRLTTPVDMTEDDDVVRTLGKLGYEPDDVDYVVISHLHEDHAGCLEYFTKSKILVSDREFTNVMKQYCLNGDMGAYIRKDIEQWLKADLHWELIDDDAEEYELLDGIKILNFGPGHTYGMMGLLVELPGTGNYIIASDTCNTSQNYGYPIRYPGQAYDSIGFYKTVKRIHKLAEKYNAQVLFSHDAEQFRQLKLAPEFYD